MAHRWQVCCGEPPVYPIPDEVRHSCLFAGLSLDYVRGTKRTEGPLQPLHSLHYPKAATKCDSVSQKGRVHAGYSSGTRRKDDRSDAHLISIVAKTSRIPICMNSDCRGREEERDTVGGQMWHHHFSAVAGNEMSPNFPLRAVFRPSNGASDPIPARLWLIRISAAI